MSGATTPHMEIRRLEPQPFACIAATTTPREVGATLRRILPEVASYLAANNLQPMGQPLARYYRYERDVVVMDAGMPIDAHRAGDGVVSVKELPGGDVAVGVHLGPYTTLKQTYDALAAWLEQEGRSPRDAPWEVYVTDPLAARDAADRQTEIYWPLH